jgi:hypothetical protein
MIDQVKLVAVEEQTAGTVLATVWPRLQQRLEAEKQRIFQEIRCYPPPIPACDVQFNALLAERVTILQELSRVNGIRNRSLPASEQLALLDEFLRSSHHLDGELADSIRQALPHLTELGVGHTHTT